MLHRRLLVLLCAGAFLASAAWADNVGYVDCSAHPDPTHVFAKPRRTHDEVTSLACGQRFTILLYGFIFSRIQTNDGKVGYIYSSLISIDQSGASLQQQPATGSAAPSAPKQPEPSSVQPVPPSAPSTAAPTVNAETPSASPQQANPPAPAQPEPSSVQVEAAPSTPPSTANAAASSASPEQANPPAPVQPQPSSVQGEAAPSAATWSSAPEPVTTPAQADSNTAAEPQPAPAVRSASLVRPADAGASWEHPNPAGRGVPRVEFFGGYAFARFESGGTGSNLMGGVGSFGWNIKPWLQIQADSSYDFITTNGVKSVIYGNHFGPRVFFRKRSRWGITPFVEGLVGGSRLDTSISGSGGYSTSDNCFSFKAGGGLDVSVARHFEVRLFDADYYRTAFGANTHQNNYWVSAGVVLRIFGGGVE